MTTLEKAIKVIVNNEGNYSSVNANDNGAVSVGICQWHADRAKKLLQVIWKQITLPVDSNWYIFETKLFNKSSWKNYVPTGVEVSVIRYILSTQQGKQEQDIQAKKDVQGYINSVLKYDITDSNTIIFLADICNQGGTGSLKRIINNTIETYGKHATLDNFMHVTLCDNVFKNYKLRRYNVYRYLTGANYLPAGEVYIHTVVKHETLSGIALKYDIPMKKIVIDNEIDNPNKIVVGQKIRIIKGV